MSIVNKKARFNYQLEEERHEAGLVLTGGEAKAIRTGHADLSNSFAKILSGEIWLVNANIPITGAKNYNPTRSRKLLLHKSEIINLSVKMKQRKLNLVPLKLYNKARLTKLELALGKSKRKFEKKESLKQMDIKREVEQEYKTG